MPPKSDTGNQEESNVWSGNGPLSALTPREQTIMLQALLSDPNFPACIQVDYVKVANRMNLKNPRSVSNAWSTIKSKIAAYDKKFREDNYLPSTEEGASTPAENYNDDDNPSPKKRARTRASRSAAVVSKRSIRAKKGVVSATPDKSGPGTSTGSSEVIGGAEGAEDIAKDQEQDMLGKI